MQKRNWIFYSFYKFLPNQIGKTYYKPTKLITYMVHKNIYFKKTTDIPSKTLCQLCVRKNFKIVFLKDVI